MTQDNPDKNKGFRRKETDRPSQGAVTDRPGRSPSLKHGEIRWCGCITPKDYPKIDIHTSFCKRYRGPKEASVAIRDNVPIDESQGRGSDATQGPTPTHQTYLLDGELILNQYGSKRLWSLLDRRRRTRNEVLK